MSSFFFLVICLLSSTHGRIHNLNIIEDTRQHILLSTFGYLRGGSMTVNVNEFAFDKAASGKESLFGFSIDKAKNNGIAGYLQKHTGQTCIFHQTEQDNEVPHVYFIIDHLSAEPKLKIDRHQSDFHLINVQQISDSHEQTNQTLTSTVKSTPKNASLDDVSLLITQIPIQQLDKKSHRFRFQFQLTVERRYEEGLYNLYFHNCFNGSNGQRSLTINLTAIVTEKNVDSYLSAGEIPLPVLYFTWAMIYFLSGFYWTFILRTSKHPVYKIHYLMLFLVLTKALSLVFHGINHHYIATKGRHEEAWAILFYITHVLRGLLLIVAILLVGTGFTFIKNVLSIRERKLFIIVIPLQILAVVAQVFLEEKEASDAVYVTWTEICFLVDLLCCGAIIFPVVWSIRHLEASAGTDGKALTSLNKLKIFRQFYVMIVFYIYLTRIVAYILKLTIPFRFEWLEVLFFELTTLVFFILTAYKFQPAINNPYLTLAQESDDEIDTEMDIPIIQNPVFDQVTKVNQKPKKILTNLPTRNLHEPLIDDDDEDGYHHIQYSTTHV